MNEAAETTAARLSVVSAAGKTAITLTEPQRPSSLKSSSSTNFVRNWVLPSEHQVLVIPKIALDFVSPSHHWWNGRESPFMISRGPHFTHVYLTAPAEQLADRTMYYTIWHEVYFLLMDKDVCPTMTHCNEFVHNQVKCANATPETVSSQQQARFYRHEHTWTDPKNCKQQTVRGVHD